MATATKDPKVLPISKGIKVASVSEQIVQLPLDQIEADPNQGRKNFGTKDDLKVLGESLLERQVQPIAVRPIKAPHAEGPSYQIIFGERRWRALKLVRGETIAAVVREIDDAGTLRDQLVENLEREDLTPMEEAAAIRDFIKRTKTSQRETARILKRDPAMLSIVLRVFELPKKVQGWLASGEMQRSHARHLLRLIDHPEELAECVKGLEWEMNDAGVTSREVAIRVDEELRDIKVRQEHAIAAKEAVDLKAKQEKRDKMAAAYVTAAKKAKAAGRPEPVKTKALIELEAEIGVAGKKDKPAPKPTVGGGSAYQPTLAERAKSIRAGKVTRVRKRMIVEMRDKLVKQVVSQRKALNLSSDQVRVFCAHVTDFHSYEAGGMAVTKDRHGSTYIREIADIVLHQLPGKWRKQEKGSNVNSGDTMNAEAKVSWLAFVIWNHVSGQKLDEPLAKAASKEVDAAIKAQGKAPPKPVAKPAAKAKTVKIRCGECNKAFDVPAGPGRRPKKCPDCR